MDEVGVAAQRPFPILCYKFSHNGRILLVPIPAKAPHTDADTALHWCQHAREHGWDRGGNLGGTEKKTRRGVGRSVGGRGRWHLDFAQSHVGPERSCGLDRGNAGAGWEDSPRVDGSHGHHRWSLRPHVVGRRAGEESGLADNLDNTRRRGHERLHQGKEVVLDLLALVVEQLAETFLLETFQSGDVCAEDKLVDGLDKVLVELLALLLLLRPVVGVGLGIRTVDLLVVLNQGINCVCVQLICDLVAQDHVNVYDVGLNVNHLEVVAHKLAGIRGHLGLGHCGEHDGGQVPDGVWR